MKEIKRKLPIWLIKKIREEEEKERNRNYVLTREEYENESEQSFNKLAKELHSLQATKRGFPDFMIVNRKTNKVEAFVEVKKNESQPLKFEQKIFGNFCKEKGIPFIVWWPKHKK